jgi:hypothetical protein
LAHHNLLPERTTCHFHTKNRQDALQIHAYKDVYYGYRRRNRISFADFAGMDTDSQKSSGEKDFEA